MVRIFKTIDGAIHETFDNSLISKDVLTATPKLQRKLSNVSEMRKSELAIGEVDTMSVSMLFEHNGEKEVTKSLTFEKMSDGNCKVTNYSFRGYETDGAERMLRTGKSLIDSCFDSKDVFNSNSKASKKVVLPSPLPPIIRVNPFDNSKVFSP